MPVTAESLADEMHALITEYAGKRNLKPAISPRK
jgi:hypothetical protein